jgi:hypothetical protein
MNLMIRQRFVQPFVLVLLLAIAALPTASAQGLPATPVPGEAPTGVLAQFPIAELPTPHAEVWFLRMGLEPGGSLPAGKQIGPVVGSVESGELTLVSDRPVTVSTAGNTGTPTAMAATPEADEYETVLQPGDSVLVNDGVSFTAMNNTSEPTSFLMIFTYEAEREGELGEGGGEPVGFTQQGISIATAEFPAGPGTLTMERIVVEPGDTVASDSGHGMGIGGIDLGAVEQGSADVSFEMGSSWRWPNILNQSEEREPIDPGTTTKLMAGDGYSTYDGSSTWVVTSDEPLIVLRVVIMPGSSG